MEKMGNFGAEKVKKHGFDWQQGHGGGGCIGESSQGKMGGNGGKRGKMGKLNQSTPAPQFLLFAPTSPHNTPFPPIFPHFPPFFLVLGTLRLRCWVDHHPPRPGISEAW